MEKFDCGKFRSQCDKCQKWVRELKRHMKMMHGPKVWLCEFCGLLFESNRKLYYHQNYYHLQPAELIEFPCSNCPKSFKTKTQYNFHFKICHLSKKPFACGICDYTGISKHQVREHTRKHTKYYPCKICKKIEPNGRRLQLHKFMEHNGKSPYHCVKCDLFFLKQNLLTLHRRTAHRSRPKLKKFICEKCGFSSASLGALEAHCRTHTGDRPFKCDVCKKGFTQTFCLKRHLIIHSNEQDYKCETCGKCFNQSCSLTRHIRVHTGEKPFSCSKCNRSFSQHAGLALHKCNSGVELKFACDDCGAKFARRKALVSHLEKKHSGVKMNLPAMC